ITLSTWTSGAWNAPRHLRAWRRIWKRLSSVWARFRSRSCTPIGLPPNKSNALDRFAKEKGPLARGKRPKSREETPKEGGGNARRYRTAIRYTAVHKRQG